MRPYLEQSWLIFLHAATPQASEKREKMEATTATEVDRQTRLVEEALAEAKRKRALAEASPSVDVMLPSASVAVSQLPEEDSSTSILSPSLDSAESQAKNARLASFVGSMGDGQQAMGAARSRTDTGS